MLSQWPRNSLQNLRKVWIMDWEREGSWIWKRLGQER